ncbi:MAG: murein biosynthesis integral membrane protein MurJ [Ruminiclostridium sp.]|nr:murein biosynthesis integral membrane protein MurJ [Ruminiclostridium sp.]
MNAIQGKRLASAAVIVMSSIILSRVTGFVRESMLSWKVGLSWAQDAYIAAFTVPDLMYNLLVGGTISAALIPVLSSFLEKDEEEKGWRATSTFINVIFSGMLLLCVSGIFLAPYIIPVVAPGFNGKSAATKELAILLTRILFPSVSFIMLAGICNGVLNSYRKFAAAAYGPTVYNLGCALSIILFAGNNRESMINVAVGVAISAFAYFLFQFAFALKNFKNYTFQFDIWNNDFIKLFKQAVPSLFSSSIVQVNFMITTAFVTMSVMEGSLAAYRNANTAWQLPYGVFAMGIGTAILPTLSRKYAAGDFDDFSNILNKSLNSILFLTIPIAVGFIVLKEPIVRAIFSWGGKFDENSVVIVAGILSFFSFAIISQSIVATLNRGFYALQDTKTPLIAGIVSVILNFIFGLTFYRFTNLQASGMALSYTIISTINAILLFILLNKKIKGVNLNKFFTFALKAVLASIAMGAALFFLDRLPVKLEAKTVQLLYLILEISAGVLVYMAVMILLKGEEALYFVNAVKGKINEGKIKCKKMQNNH